MESTEFWSTRELRRRPGWQWTARIFDAIALLALLSLLAGLAFAVFQGVDGSPGWAIFGLLVAALSALGVYARWIAPFWLRVKRLEIGNPDRDGPGGLPKGALSLKIVYFTDLHVGRVKQAAWTRKVVALANAQHPDAVLLGGDFVGHVDSRLIPGMLAPLADLRAPLGVFAVLGNHDYGLPGVNQSELLQGLFRQTGIRLLRNENVRVAGRLELVGIDELWEGCSDVPRAFAGTHPERASQEPTSHEQPLRRVVLGHNPDLMAHIDRKADLFLFGHTHGGQIYIPFITRFIVPVENGRFRGTYHLPQGLLYISYGCGETTTPTRLGTRPEIVSIIVR